MRNEHGREAMIVRFSMEGGEYTADLAAGRSIAIPMRFGGPQPNSYDVPPANAQAYEDGAFIGDTRRGGSCNFETVTLTPHCNGTHTECAGHVTAERLSVESLLAPGLLSATLVSVAPEPAPASGETSAPRPEEGDYFITASALRTALRGVLRDAPSDGPAFLQALVVRTLPNDEGKTARRYMEAPAPYFSIEAMRHLRALGVQHLLVDIPSLDRARDEGRMTAHRIFWDMPAGSRALPEGSARARTVTEMIFVPDDIPDGRYLIDLQIAPFAADAAPSRPVLFAITSVSAGT
jgi:arylformamidase